MQYQQFIDPVIQAILGVLASVLVGAILGVGRKVTRLLDSKTTVAEREHLHHLAAEAVALVKSLYADNNGAQKLEAAIAYVNAKLPAGVQITGDEIRAAIEKAYLDYKAKTTQPAPAEPIKVEVPVPQPLDPAVQQLIDAAKALGTGTGQAPTQPAQIVAPPTSPTAGDPTANLPVTTSTIA